MKLKVECVIGKEIRITRKNIIKIIGIQIKNTRA